MRYLIFFLLILLACNKSQVVEDCPGPQQLELKTIAGFFVLDTDYRITNLDESINLVSENLAIGYSYDDGILFFESDELNFHEWRNIGIAIHGIETHGKFSVQEYTTQYSEIQLDEDLNNWIYENQDAPIFFKLNLEI